MNDIVTTNNTPSTLSAALGNAARLVEMMPSVKLDAFQKVNMLNNAVSLSKAREANGSNELVLELVGIAAGPVHFTTSEGEIVDGLSAIFITPDGKGYYSQSQPLMRAVGSMIAVLGSPSNWKKPVKCRFGLRMVGGTNLNTLEIVK